MSDLLEEIKEDLKSEALAGFIVKYGKLIVSAVFIIVIALSLYVYVGYRSIVNQEKLSTQYYNSLITNKIDSFISDNSKSGYNSLAVFKSVDSKVLNKKPDEAYKELKDFVDSTDNKYLSDFAKLRLAEIVLSSETKDSNKYVEVLNLLESSSENSDIKSAMRFFIAQIQIEQREFIKAKVTLNKIQQDSEAPEGIKGLAKILLSSI